MIVFLINLNIQQKKQEEMKSIIILFIFVSFVCGQTEKGGVEKIGPCRMGYFVNETNGCQVCVTGYYCPDGKQKIECPDGTYSGFGEPECTKCGCVKMKTCRKNETYKIPGDYMSGVEIYAGSCDGPCKQRFAYDSMTKECLPCPELSFCPGGYNGSLSCRRNYEPNEEQTGCVKCGPRMVSMGSNCHTCYKGTIYNEERKECEYCPEDMEQDENDDTKCVPCPEGYGRFEFISGGCVTWEEKNRVWIAMHTFL